MDNQAFAEGAEAARSDSDSFRIRLGLPERYFLFVGRFAREKNLPCLLEAYAKYRAVPGHQAWGIVLVGGGPLESELRVLAQDLRDVVFAGFQYTNAISDYFGLASCLVLPSISETWGLVVNEAMAAGFRYWYLTCGCVPELVQPGVNGYVCNPLDTDGMARLLGVMSSETVDASNMGEASRQIVALYTPETWAQTLADCIERMLVCKQRNVERARVQVDEPRISAPEAGRRFANSDLILNAPLRLEAG